MRPAANVSLTDDDFAVTTQAEPDGESGGISHPLAIRHPVTQKHRRVRSQTKARVRIRRLKH